MFVVLFMKGFVKSMTYTAFDPSYQPHPDLEVIYLAGGCFWGLEKLMQSIPGVQQAISGYANGKESIIPNYNLVCSGKTDYRETVRVEYDPKKVSLDAILFAFFKVIDVTLSNAQGNDFGSQYQTGIYYTTEEDRKIVEGIANIIRARSKKFAVEIKPLERFYKAEEYHQDYLDKNPHGYCHIAPHEFKEVQAMLIDPGHYRRPGEQEIEAKLTPQQFGVTQHGDTEPPHFNEYDKHFEKGIYVDRVTGEPLFSSKDKFQSGCGWPSFSKPIDPSVVVPLRDLSLGMVRTEIRSRSGNSHLGHLFNHEPYSPTGDRYCMNSAALRFVGYAEMEAQGYGYLKRFVE